MNLQLVLPYPPTQNTAWRTGPRGNYLSKRGREYRAEVREETWAQLPVGFTQLESMVLLAVTVYPPDKRIRDLDNILKPLIDALTHAGVWLDDYQVCEIHARRMDVKKPGAAIVTITERNYE